MEMYEYIFHPWSLREMIPPSAVYVLPIKRRLRWIHKNDDFPAEY